VRSCGLVRRSRKHNGMDDWETQENVKANIILPKTANLEFPSTDVRWVG
jgi:hypothetical protein